MAANSLWQEVGVAPPKVNVAMWKKIDTVATKVKKETGQGKLAEIGRICGYGSGSLSWIENSDPFQ